MEIIKTRIVESKILLDVKHKKETSKTRQCKHEFALFYFQKIAFYIAYSKQFLILLELQHIFRSNYTVRSFLARVVSFSVGPKKLTKNEYEMHSDHD